MFCSHCGKQIPDNAKFCPACGTPVTGSGKNKPNPMELLRHKSTSQSAGEPVQENKSSSGLIFKVAILFFVVMVLLSLIGEK